MTKIPISEKMIGRWKYLVECDFHNTDVIRMLRAQAKREGNDELRKELDRLLPLSLEKDEEYKKEKEIENKKLWDKHQKDLEEQKQKEKQEDVAYLLELLKQEVKQNKANQNLVAEDLKKINRQGKYFITHIDNLPSILERGILSPAYVKAAEIKPTNIKDKNIDNKRDNIRTSDGSYLILDDYAHVFFNYSNAFVYNVSKKYGRTKIVMIELILNVSDEGVYITDKNAAIDDAQCWDSSQCHESIPLILEDTLPIGRSFSRLKKWSDGYDGSMGKVMAECLVKDKISRDCIKNILVFNESLYDQKSQAEIKKIRPLAEALGIGIKLLK